MKDERKPITTIKLDWTEVSFVDVVSINQMINDHERDFLIKNITSIPELTLIKAPIPLMSYFMQNPDFTIQSMASHENAVISFGHMQGIFSCKHIPQMKITFKQDVDLSTSVYAFYNNTMNRKIDDFLYTHRDYETELFEYLGWIKQESSFPDVFNYTKVLFTVRFRCMTENTVIFEIIEISL